MKRFLALLLVLTLAISLTACNTQPKPFYTDAEDVLASDLENLPTDEVLRAVLEYPRLFLFHAYSTNELAVEQTARQCTALKVFLTRPDARQMLDEVRANPDDMLARMQTDDDQKKQVPGILDILETYFKEVDP